MSATGSLRMQERRFKSRPKSVCLILGSGLQSAGCETRGRSGSFVSAGLRVGERDEGEEGRCAGCYWESVREKRRTSRDGGGSANCGLDVAASVRQVRADVES